MSIYATFIAVQIIDGEIEYVENDTDLPQIRFYWSEISDLFDGYRQELLQLNPSIKFNFFDTLDQDFQLFNPYEVLDTIQKIKTILVTNESQLPQVFTVVLEGFEKEPLSKVGTLGINGQPIDIYQGFNRCYYRFQNQPQTKDVDIRRLKILPLELLMKVQDKFEIKGYTQAWIIRSSLNNYYSNILEKMIKFVIKY